MEPNVPANQWAIVQDGTRSNVKAVRHGRRNLEGSTGGARMTCGSTHGARYNSTKDTYRRIMVANRAQRCHGVGRCMRYMPKSRKTIEKGLHAPESLASTGTLRKMGIGLHWTVEGEQDHKMLIYCGSNGISN